MTSGGYFRPQLANRCNVMLRESPKHCQMLAASGREWSGPRVVGNNPRLGLPSTSWVDGDFPKRGFTDGDSPQREACLNWRLNAPRVLALGENCSARSRLLVLNETTLGQCIKV